MLSASATNHEPITYHSAVATRPQSGIPAGDRRLRRISSAVPQTGSAAITLQLRRAIVDGEFALGEKLPPERRLAEHFGTSRSTVREALRQLEAMKLVTRRVGSGTFVRYRQQADIAETTSPLELIDVRAAVEPQMVRLAVIHATGRELERLREGLRQVESCGDDPERFSRGDEEFHLALAECARNPLLLWLYGYINDVRTHKQWNARKDKILTPEHIALYNRQHRRLFEAITSRDLENAVAAITEHLDLARRDLLGVDRNVRPPDIGKPQQ